MKRKPTLTIYRNRAGRYNWTLRAANGEPLAKGCGERANGFASAGSAIRNARLVAKAMRWAFLAPLPKPGQSLDLYTDRNDLRITREAE